MKLQCNVEVINRVHNSLNIRSNGKHLKSTLAIGKEPKEAQTYFIILFSSVNKTGTKYKLKKLKQVFVKCLNEGKATLRFEEPPHDLSIRSEVIQLKGFMSVLKSCITGDKDIKIQSLCSLSVTGKDTAPKKLVIHNRSDFPPKGLPRTLESLYISGLKLCNFRRDILLLRHLTILDLSNNEVEKIPPEFGRMPNITELHLANNSLGTNENIDWRWLTGPQITKTLKLLDLSGNSLKYLPKSIWKLQKLVTLKIDNNSIVKLPCSIGRLSTLRFLTVSENKLTSLPCSVLHCKLDSIDVSSNDFQSNKEDTTGSQTNGTPWDYYVGSLVNVCARVVLLERMFYAPNIVPFTLVEFLDDAKMCVCGRPVLGTSFSINKVLQIKDVFREVIFDTYGSSAVKFECYFCSHKCFAKHAR